MHNFEYVPKSKTKPVKIEIIKLINEVQDDVRNTFTFSYEFIGSEPRNMVTYDSKSNIGFDFDVNIRVNKVENFTAKQIKTTLINGFNNIAPNYGFDYCEDSKRVITIKIKDKKNSKILFSCDFAIVHDYIDDYGDERQEYIFLNKKTNKYVWQDQPDGFYELPEKEEWCKENGLWNDVLKLYLILKDKNTDKNKKSRSIYAETIHQICQKNGYFDYEEDYDDYYGDDDY